MVEEEGDERREIKEMESSGDRGKEREGVYPPVEEGKGRKRMKGKRIRAFPLSHDGTND